MRNLAFCAAILAAGCSAVDGPGPATAPATSAQDPKLAEIQIALTEMLERMDVQNERIARLEEARTVAAAPASAAVVARPRPVEEAARPEPSASPIAAATQTPQRALVGAALADDYRKAITLFGGGRHADARAAFEAIFNADQGGDLADNALFWIGETYFAAGDYTNAMRYYRRIVTDYSDQNKAPDALLKTALSLARTGDLALARKTLQQVIADFPYSTAASSAKAELQRIRF